MKFSCVWTHFDLIHVTDVSKEPPASVFTTEALLRFLKYCPSRLLKIQFVRDVTVCCWVFPDVSKDCSAFMFKVKQTTTSVDCFNQKITAVLYIIYLFIYLFIYILMYLKQKRIFPLHKMENPVYYSFPKKKVSHMWISRLGVSRFSRNLT
jgi:hypothetical protein